MKKTAYAKEDIENEIAELETDQHPDFFKNEQKGRKRMSALLQELNMIEESKTKNSKA